MRELDRLGKVLVGQTQPVGEEEHVGIVTALRADGKLNVMVNGGTWRALPALSSYDQRVPGDIVVVRLVKGSGRIVMGRSGFSPAEIADQTADDPAPSPPSLDPETLYPTFEGTWRDGRRREDVNIAVQGNDPENHGDNTGAWFYGTALSTAIGAGTVNKVELELARVGSRHGRYRSVPVRLYVHNESTVPSDRPTMVGGPWTLGGLELGERQNFRIPGGAITELEGTGRGFAVYSGPTNYIRFASCGRVRVTYD